MEQGARVPKTLQIKMVLWNQDQTGRKSAMEDEDLVAVVRDATLSDRHSTAMSAAQTKNETQRALTTSKMDIWRELKSKGKCKVSYNTFRQMVSGKKKSAVPELRKQTCGTDRCVVCMDAKNHIIMPRKPGQAAGALGEEGLNLVEEVMTFIENHKVQLDSIYMSRNEQHSMNLLLQKLESAKITCMGDVGMLMEDVALLSKHIFIKNTIRTDFNEARMSVTSKTLVTNSDWKENVKRERGHKEDSTVVHTI